MAQSPHEATLPVQTERTDPEHNPALQLPQGGDKQSADLNIPKLLSALGLTELQGGKLTLSSVLEINKNAVFDEPVQNVKQLPMSFLKKLMISNINARNIHCKDQNKITSKCSLSAFLSKMVIQDDSINPLDLITALFHCSDPFLQQEMVSKMYKCQFAVPLLLPNCDTGQSTLMLWAMRDLIKKFRPQFSADSKAFVEGRIVEMDIPMLSFVKLGRSSLPKSQTMNKLLSSHNQQNHTFVHSDMECGNVPRKISDGLVEISWYFPCGNTNIDIFTQPVAIANLRGDGKCLKTQMSFLCQTSAAVFIFSDNLNGDLNFPNNTELFLVMNSQGENFNIDTLVDTCTKYNIKESNVIIKSKENDAEFLKALRQQMCKHVCPCNDDLIEKGLKKMKVEDMAAVAHTEGILVDEDEADCVKGRQNSEDITNGIKDVVEFKETHLPLHGNIWKEISQVEKEKCRLNKADREQSIEHYKCSLISKERQLREKQRQMEISIIMDKFIKGISQSGMERLYFLKWLKIKLDTLSRQNLSELREEYKKFCRNTPLDKNQIAQIDEQISKCSLGSEHFFRELGQLYESTSSLPENDPARKLVRDLPALCAQMLIDGYPMELVDGDSSNIPMNWISEVMTQLHKLVGCKSRILVLTVLGVQGTGKSTLLNTMFGVQFAVSSGRCTRGAFMQFIKVSEDFKFLRDQCDFLMVIDTEGLKSPELAALDTSYEHDNELATLVIGLSDITIVNVPMENSTEMKDILQIVVHAFLRMKEVGKKPRCVFVHQNVSDMAAHESTMRDRKKLLEQLDEMTQTAAKMENMEDNTKFTDVMEYDPDKDSYFIPGLWYGTPPMAPVNAGYSEAVYELKKSLISSLMTAGYTKANDAKEFVKWTNSLWNAVKFENFIFNFRNSLVAVAYSELCTQYNTWEWSFQKVMSDWLITQETMMSNFGLNENVQISFLQNKLQEVLNEASDRLYEEEKKILANIDKYFEKKDGKVHLVERYREDFRTSAKSLKQGTENSIKYSLKRVVEITQGMEKVNEIKNSQIDIIETKVQELLKKCREKREDLSYSNLPGIFEKMWTEITAELSGFSLPETDVYANVLNLLNDNLKSKSGKVSDIFNTMYLKRCSEEKFIVTAEWFSDWNSSFQKLWNNMKHMDSSHFIAKIQDICDDVVIKCEENISNHISNMEKNNTDYHGTYIKDILNIVDNHKKHHLMTDECEARLKFHVCGCAAKRFQGKHKEFNARNDPQKCLIETKIIFLNKFLESFCENDQCQKKAINFIEIYVKPAVQDYVSKHIGQNIVKAMRTGNGRVDYNTQTHLQFAILKHLLDEDSFQKYKEYIGSYEAFAKDWIKQQVIQELSESGQIPQLQNILLSEIIQKIILAITNSSNAENLQMFMEQFCNHTRNYLVFPQHILRTFLSLSEVRITQFATILLGFVKEMKESLAREYDSKTGKDHITEMITNLPSKPHELLFASLCGCEHQCPFCGAPCEAGGQHHAQHFSNMHRPVGLGHRTVMRHKTSSSEKVVADICNSLVLRRVFIVRGLISIGQFLGIVSRDGFVNDKTKGELRSYKDYREIYPDWVIKGDSSIQASIYWKYVLMTYNNEFAKAFGAQPADIPPSWQILTKQDAVDSLVWSFYMK